MRDIREIQVEVREMADVIRIHRERLVRLLEELERDHTTKDDAWLQMVEDKVPPNVSYYLQGLLAILEEQDLAKIDGQLRQASTITDNVLGETWRKREQRQNPGVSP